MKYVDIFAALGVILTPILLSGPIASVLVLIFLTWLVGRVVHRLSR